VKLRLGSMFVVGLSMAACGGGSGGSGPSKPSDALKESIQGQCDRAHECKASYDAAMHDGDTFESLYGASSQACYDNIISLINQFQPTYLSDLDAAAAAGRIMYDSDDFGTCLDALTGASCDAFFEQNGMMLPDPPQCDTALVGTVAAGGACTLDDECAGGNGCDIPDGATMGTCTP